MFHPNSESLSLLGFAMTFQSHRLTNLEERKPDTRQDSHPTHLEVAHEEVLITLMPYHEGKRYIIETAVNNLCSTHFLGLPAMRNPFGTGLGKG